MEDLSLPLSPSNCFKIKMIKKNEHLHCIFFKKSIWNKKLKSQERKCTPDFFSWLNYLKIESLLEWVQESVNNTEMDWKTQINFSRSRQQARAAGRCGLHTSIWQGSSSERVLTILKVKGFVFVFEEMFQESKILTVNLSPNRQE